MNDLVSRQEALETLLIYRHSILSSEEIISLIPSAQERKVGKWIDEPVYRQTMDGKTWDGYTYCSICKDMYEYGYRSNFCPNCGAEMKGESDG